MKALSADLARPLDRRLVWWMLGAYLAVLVPQVTYQPYWVLGFAVGTALARAWMEQHGWRAPAWWWPVGLATVVAVLTWITQSTLWGRDGGTVLMIGFLGVKLLESRTRRDYYIVLLVGYFLTVATLLFSQSIVTCLGLAAGVWVLTCAMVQPQTQRVEGDNWNGKLAVRLILQALPMAALLFVFFPRLETQLGFDLGIARTGLPESISPGSITKLMQSDEVAFRAEFPNGDRPPSQDLYWRAFLLYRFEDGKRWRTSELTPEFTGKEMERRGLLRISGPTVLQRITVTPHSRRWLFTLDYPVQIPERGVAFREGHFLESRVPVTRKRQYVVQSVLGPLLADTSELMRQQALDTSFPVDPRVRALAESFKEGGADDVEILRRVQEWMQRQKLDYTLTPRRVEGDSTAAFLFETKEGFCEDFSSAFAVLMRLAGVPTRLVAGYVGGEQNPLTGFLVVRQFHAHSWTEVWSDAAHGWKRVDPTMWSPASSRIQNSRTESVENTEALDIARNSENNWQRWLPQGIKDRLQQGKWRWQQVEASWDEWILSYDSEAQQQLVQWMGFERRVTTLLASCVIILVLVVGGLTFWMGRVERVNDPVERRYREIGARLADLGVRREMWEGPIAFTNRASEAFPDLEKVLKHFGQSYAAWRYGLGSTGTFLDSARDLETLLKHKSRPRMQVVS